MKSNGKGKISYALQAINIIPLLFFGIIIMLLGTNWFTRCMYNEVQTELSDAVSYLTTMYDALYPGDYELIGEDAYQLYKGDYNLTNDYTLIDQLHEQTDLDITLFYQDTRILTTIVSGNQSGTTRIVGTGAPTVVIEDVLKTGEAHFYTKTLIYQTSYFSYYAPLKNSDGSIVGMIFVGKPTAKVDAAIQKAVYPLFIANVILIIIVSLFTSLYTKGFVTSLMQIHRFLKAVSNGNLDTGLSSKLLNRRDELGEIAHSALTMQHSLHMLVEQDALTQLANRRSGDRKLREIVSNSFSSGREFCVVLGDIDFFKKVNDTYGHECGDLVLKNVSYILRTHMREKGLAARWGGEEFLLVFDGKGKEEALQILERILDDIRSMESEFDGQKIKVTMTFGLTVGNTDDVTALLRSADEMLYLGKTTGRNRIISETYNTETDNM